MTVRLQMSVLIAIALVIVLSGCTTIHVPPTFTRRACANDPALVGDWSDARMSQLGPAWVHVTFRADCSVRITGQLLFYRVTEESTFSAVNGELVIAGQNGRDQHSTYRVTGDRLEWTEAPGEICTYQRQKPSR